MPERTRIIADPCYGCVNLTYEGPASVKGVPRLMGGTAIPLREQDARNGPGRYSCSKFGKTITRADREAGPKELELGCKEAR